MVRWLGRKFPSQIKTRLVTFERERPKTVESLVFLLYLRYGVEVRNFPRHGEDHPNARAQVCGHEKKACESPEKPKLNLTSASCGAKETSTLDTFFSENHRYRLMVRELFPNLVRELCPNIADIVFSGYDRGFT